MKDHDDGYEWSWWMCGLFVHGWFGVKYNINAIPES